MNRLGLSREFLLLWIGQLISTVGTWVSSFALGIWVLRTSGSTTQYAITFILTAVPAILASPLAGALADRWNRRKIMMTCDVLSTILIVALAMMLVAGRMTILQVYVIVVCSSLLESFRSPAFFASIPLLVPMDKLPRVNAMVQTGGAISGIVGPLAAGVLVSLISFRGVLLIDAATYFIGALTLMMVVIPHTPKTAEEQSSNLLDEAMAGWRYVKPRPGLLGLLGIFGCNNFIFSMASVLIAPLVLSFSNAGMVGVQYAISSGGLLLGGIAITAFGGPKKRIQGVIFGSLVAGVCMAAHGLRPSFLLVAIAGFIFFMMVPVQSAASTSLWQSKVPANLQGRCFAMKQLLLHLVTGSAYCLAGPLSDYVFGPMLLQNGALASSVGTVIGVGPGRGIGLMFIILGTSMSLVALAAYGIPAIRDIDAMENAFMPNGETKLPTGEANLVEAGS